MTYPPSGYGSFGPVGPPGPPPVPPQYGYLVPTAPGYGGADPLVTAPHEGFSGWFGRVFSVLRRSWLSLLLISWVTFGVPIALLVAAFSIMSDHLVGSQSTFVAGSGQPPTIDTSWLGTFVVIVLVGAVVSAFATSVANAAAVWAVTREAAGHPRSLGGALGYGLRNGPRLFGWSLLFGLLLLVGTCACIIPGLYFGLAGCLYVPIALYRRGLNPISTSFSLINRNFGAALGRMALLFVILYGVQLALAVPVQLLSFQSRPVAIGLSIVLQFVTAPLALVPWLGSTLLFAELFNRQTPLTTAHLDAAVAPAG